MQNIRLRHKCCVLYAPDTLFSNNNNLDTISLEVKSDYIDAINFYLKNDFKKVSIRKKYYGNMDGYLMVKKVR